MQSHDINLRPASTGIRQYHLTIRLVYLDASLTKRILIGHGRMFHT